MAIKINEDDYYSNSYYAKVAGVTLKELNQIEFEFTVMTKYKLFVQKDLYDKYAGYLKNYNVNKTT
jgi:hypothetical protein